jgi:hypothetical protein
MIRHQWFMVMLPLLALYRATHNKPLVAVVGN